MNKKIWLQNNLAMVTEQVPLLVFVAIHNLDFSMEARIITGGVLSIPVLNFIIVKKAIVSSTFLGANIFLFICMLILLSPIVQLSQVLMSLGEPVMIVVIILCSLIVTGAKIGKSFFEDNKSKISILTMIVAMLVSYIACIIISFLFSSWPAPYCNDMDQQPRILEAFF